MRISIIIIVRGISITKILKVLLHFLGILNPEKLTFLINQKEQRLN